MQFRHLFTALLFTTLLASAQDNSTETDDSGDMPADTVILSTHTPTPANNFIPNSSDKISARIETDRAGNYTAIVAEIAYDVITAPRPNRPTDGTLCNSRGECVGGYHAYIELPKYDQFPYRTLQINWNPYGHSPAPFRVNHIDYHLHTQTLAELKAIEVGECGAEHVTCDKEIQKKLTAPLEARHLPEGYSNAQLDTSVANIGSHLVDFSTVPSRPEDFDHILIHGAYDGKLSFQEPMITEAYFIGLKRRTQENSVLKECFDISQPEEYPDDDFHPDEWCAWYEDSTDSIHVSLESFSADRSVPPNSGVTATTSYLLWIVIASAIAMLTAAL
ncbi:MAG: hypothetical protein ACR2PT_20630 [Endozoicomonas sp.]